MADVQYVTLYLPDGTTVSVVFGSALYATYLASGATTSRLTRAGSTPSGSAAPDVRTPVATIWYSTPFGPQPITDHDTQDEYKRRDYPVITAAQAAAYYASSAQIPEVSFVTEQEIVPLVADAVNNNPSIAAAVRAMTEPLSRTLGWSQLDRQGASSLAVAQGRARLVYETAPEIVEDWADLASVTSTAVGVNNNRLYGTGAAPNGAKIPVTIGANGFRASTSIFVPTNGAVVFFGVAGAASAAPTASSVDAFVIGVRGSKFPGYLRGTSVGGTGQADLSTTDTLVAGEELYATVVVDPVNVSLSLRRVSTKVEYTRQVPRSAFDAVGGVGNLLCYVGPSSDGTAGHLGPVVGIGAQTMLRTKTVAGYTVGGAQPVIAYTGPAGATDNWRIQLPPGYDPRVPAPLVLWLHNNGGTATSVATDSRSKPLMDALAAAGYLVASADAGLAAWANDSSRAQYAALFEYMRAHYAISGVVLVAQSMGGQVALNLLPRNEIPNVAAYLGIAAVASLDDLYAHGYDPQIRAAFGIAANGSDYDTKTAGYRPEDRAGWEFRGVPMMLVHSPADATCSIAEAQALAAKARPYAPEATVITSTGAHMAAEQFATAVTYGVPFLQKYAPVL